MTLWIIYLTSAHPKLSKNVYVYYIMPSSLFTMIFFKRAKTVRYTGAEHVILWCLE